MTVGIKLGMYSFLVLSLERVQILFLEEIIKLGINELEECRYGGITPESSKVGLKAKFWKKSLVLVVS